MGSSRSKGSRIHGVHNQLSKVSETSPRPGWDVPRCRGAVSGLPGRVLHGRDFRIGAAGADCHSPGQRPQVASVPAAAASAASSPGISEGRVFSAHRVEPKMHDDEPLLFKGDEGEPGTPAGQEGSELLAEAVLFEASPSAPQESAQQTDHPVEALAAPLSEEGHDLAAEAAEGAAPWGGAWADSKTKPRTRKTAPSDWPSPTRTKAWSTLTSPPLPARQRRVVAGFSVDRKPPRSRRGGRAGQEEETQAGSEPFPPHRRHRCLRSLGRALRIVDRALRGCKAGFPPQLGSADLPQTQHSRRCAEARRGIQHDRQRSNTGQCHSDRS